MPTVIEPKANEEPKPKLVPSPSNEPELFAAEIAMEKSWNLFPLILILGLVVVVGGTIWYFVKGARDVLTTPVATSTIQQILKSQGPATVQFSTGTVDLGGQQDPHYELLAKVGVVNVKASKGNATLHVAVTEAGNKLLASIEGVKDSKQADGSDTYVVPLAERELVSVDNVKMIKPHLAQVDYTWKWQANRLGEDFDASSNLVRSFSTWDRSTLIKSFGVDFYSAAPTKATLVLLEGDNGTWKPYSE